MYILVYRDKLLVTNTDKYTSISLSTILEVAQNLGTIATTYYLSTCMSHVVMTTDGSIRLGLANIRSASCETVVKE